MAFVANTTHELFSKFTLDELALLQSKSLLDNKAKAIISLLPINMDSQQSLVEEVITYLGTINVLTAIRVLELHL